MVADTFHGRGHIAEIKGTVLRMASIARQPELLPDKETHLVTKLVEVVGFGNATAPETNKVDTRLTSIPQLGIGTFVRTAKHAFRNPVGSTDKKATPVDIKDT